MKIALIGYGKMGKAVEAIAMERNHEVVFISSGKESTEDFISGIQQAEVAIEFTGASSALSNILTCFKYKTPVVSGSTGWLHDYHKAVQACKESNGALVYSSNFSIGVNIFFRLNSILAEIMKGREYVPEIKEIHHVMKKDAPSGTALSLAEQIIAENPYYKNWSFQPNQNEIKITSERTADVPGTHIVHYRSEIDDIEIIHTAHNRKGFALGAVIAAEFLKGKKGVFGMQDVLNI